jgi:DNA polymerase III alpha subunit
MSSISIDDIINRAVKHKQTHVALIDINNMYGAMEFYQKATTHGLKPIIGLQITYQNETVVLVSKNNLGYHNLVKLSSRVMTNVAYDLNDFTEHTYVIVHNAHDSKWLKHKNDVYSVISTADAPIALQECFFENEGDVKYRKALMAIGSDQRLTDFDNNHDFDQCFMLDDTQAKHKFNDISIKNLEKLINTCT